MTESGLDDWVIEYVFHSDEQLQVMYGKFRKIIDNEVDIDQADESEFVSDDEIDQHIAQLVEAGASIKLDIGYEQIEALLENRIQMGEHFENDSLEVGAFFSKLDAMVAAGAIRPEIHNLFNRKQALTNKYLTIWNLY